MTVRRAPTPEVTPARGPLPSRTLSRTARAGISLLICVTLLAACQGDTTSTSVPLHGTPVGSLVVRREGTDTWFALGASGPAALAIGFEPGAIWSPDGRSVAFTRGSAGRWRLVVSDSGGRNRRTLVGRRYAPHLGAAAWSPDGRELAFLCDICRRLGGPVPEIVDVATGAIHRVVGPPSGMYFDGIDWGGRWLALHGRGGFWIGPAAGGAFRRIVSAGAGEDWDLSPSGNTIAAETESDACLTRAIDIISVPSGATSRIVSSSDYVFAPVWSPDGNWIAFTFLPAAEIDPKDCSARGPETTEIRIVPLAGGAQRTLYRGAAWAIAWVPEG